MFLVPCNIQLQALGLYHEVVAAKANGASTYVWMYMHMFLTFIHYM